MKRVCLAIVVALAAAPALRADPPHASYIFPAGGQRGTTVRFHVGGHYLHDACSFEMYGPGVEAAQELIRAETTLWFEGPLIPLPDSQRQDAQDIVGVIAVTANDPTVAGYPYPLARAHGRVRYEPTDVVDLRRAMESLVSESYGSRLGMRLFGRGRDLLDVGS